MTIEEFFKKHPNVSIAELAEAADIDPALIHRYEKGKHPGKRKLKRIQEVINDLGGVYANIKLEQYKPVLFGPRPLNEDERARFRSGFINAKKQHILKNGHICSFEPTS
jgi:transcriptional regulator with XRE-family HTH domain